MLLCSTEKDNGIWSKIYYFQLFCLTAVESKENFSYVKPTAGSGTLVSQCNAFCQLLTLTFAK